jgi:outer membrane biosynthesis protein TonB
LASVTLPQKVQKMNLSGSVEYRMLIDKEGKVVSYELLSTPTNLGIEEAYQQAIEKSLLFKPILRDGKPVQATCYVALPIKQ